ncbi:hypothetical protein [Roseibium sp. M-1]
MARFPYHEKNVKELGRLIAKAALDDDFRRELQTNPARELAAIGLPKQTTELLRFKVVDCKAQPNATAVPFRLNQAKLDALNEDYISGLAKIFKLN